MLNKLVKMRRHLLSKSMVKQVDHFRDPLIIYRHFPHLFDPQMKNKLCRPVCCQIIAQEKNDIASLGGTHSLEIQTTQKYRMKHYSNIFFFLTKCIEQTTCITFRYTFRIFTDPFFPCGSYFVNALENSIFCIRDYALHLDLILLKIE